MGKHIFQRLPQDPESHWAQTSQNIQHVERREGFVLALGPFCLLSSTHTLLSGSSIARPGLSWIFFFYLGNEIILTIDFCSLCHYLAHSPEGSKASTKTEKPQKTVTKYLPAYLSHKYVTSWKADIPSKLIIQIFPGSMEKEISTGKIISQP